MKSIVRHRVVAVGGGLVCDVAGDAAIDGLWGIRGSASCPRRFWHRWMRGVGGKKHGVDFEG